MALAAVTIVSFIVLPVMADLAYGPAMNWNNTPAQAKAQRDQIISVYAWYPMLIGGMIITWAVLSSTRKQPDEYDSNDFSIGF